MARRSPETTPSKGEPRESDNPIVEEYKEDMLRKPTYGARPTLDGEERLCNLESQLANLMRKVDALERSVLALQGRGR